MSEPDLTYLWYQALSSERGIELICSNTEAARRKLYEARKATGDPELSTITIAVSPFDPCKLWLKKGKGDATT